VIQTVATDSQRAFEQQRIGQRRQVRVPGRLTWRDASGTLRFASVMTRDVSDVDAFVECQVPASIPLYRLVHFQIEGTAPARQGAVSRLPRRPLQIRDGYAAWLRAQAARRSPPGPRPRRPGGRQLNSNAVPSLARRESQHAGPFLFFSFCFSFFIALAPVARESQPQHLERRRHAV
jgi:hypothetical protein